MNTWRGAPRRYPERALTRPLPKRYGCVQVCLSFLAVGLFAIHEVPIAGFSATHCVLDVINLALAPIYIVADAHYHLHLAAQPLLDPRDDFNAVL